MFIFKMRNLISVDFVPTTQVKNVMLKDMKESTKFLVTQKQVISVKSALFILAISKVYLNTATPIILDC